MKKKIVMYGGDEYRAKTEKRFEEDLFFADVYRRANSICREIIKETGEYLERHNKTGYKTKFQGMGNNIISFCAERGQGKTTALQSYAEYLQEKGQRDEKLFGEECIDKEKYYFVVLDPIDPSSLDHGESIVRVLISRLFYLLSEKLNKGGSSGDEKQFRKEREEILSLFQKCYENIDYLQKDKAVEEDDLEVLAQLGSSAQLKKNLYGLVERFLHIYCQEEGDGRNGRKRGYLVVQIDDADLSMGDVFEVCENIRNYFTVPNIIVMMAANYTQLKAAIHEKYLGRYHKLVTLQENGGFADECHRMAYRYLEKMLPAGHRIDLPEVDAVLDESSQYVLLEYYRDDHTEIFQKEAENCADLQEQLLKMLYLRTGIVLLKREDELHPFLPHTMRELTHFVKMLGDMERVDQQKVFGAGTEEEKEREARKWEENLLLLKEYFLNYWCGTHLGYGQQRLIRELDQAKRNMKSANKSVRDYLKNSDEIKGLKEDTYRNILAMMEKGMKKEAMLQDAMQIYYTILLNEWFVRAVGSQEQLKSISAFVEEPVFLGIDFRKKKHRYANKYDVIEFGFSRDTLQGFLQHQETLEGQVIEWLKTFCVSVGGEAETEPVEILDGKLVWKEEVEELQFNMFRPIMTMLYSKIPGGGSDMEKAVPDSMEDDEKTNLNGEEGQKSDVAYRISAKNIVANLEVQQYVQDRVVKLVQRFEKRKKIPQWKTIYEEIYGMIDSWAGEETRYLEEKSVIRDKCSEYLGKEMGQLVFLCNDQNREEYAKDYKEHLQKRIDDINDEVGRIEKMSSEEDMVMAVKRFATNKRLRTFSGIVDEQKSLRGIDQLLDRLMDMEQSISNAFDKLPDEREEDKWGTLFGLFLPKSEEKEKPEEDNESIAQKMTEFKDRILACKAEIEKL